MTDIDLSSVAAPATSPSPCAATCRLHRPGAVMIHEIFGLDDVMRRHADHLAGLGYLTLAVDLFSSGGTARCLVCTMTAMMRGHGRAFAEISAGRDYLTGSITSALSMKEGST
jgi:carboxymethylenebutenolidase